MLGLSLLLEIWLITLLLQRQVTRRFPIFFVFTLYTALANIARLATIENYRHYFYVYWSTDAILIVLSLAALHEVFHWTFEGFYRLWWFRFLYYGAIVFVVVLAIRNAVVNPPVQARPIISLIVNIGIAVNFVLAGIVALFYLFKRLVGVEFNRYAYGIVAGFGVFAAGPLLAYFAFSVFGTKMETFTRYTLAVAYILSLAIWIASFIRPESGDEEWQAPMSPDQMLEEVQGYLRGLGISKRKR